MTRLAAVLVQILDSKKTPVNKVRAAAERLPQAEDADAAKALFERCYDIADRFTFTPDFLGETYPVAPDVKRTVEWLGGVGVSRDGDAEYARSDFFLVTNRFHRSAAIHHHLNFGGRLDLTEWKTEAWRSCVNTLHELYWSWNWTQDRRNDPSNIGERLDPLVRTLVPPSPTLFATRGFYVSLYDADRGLISGWRAVAPALYSLLYLHSEGFDEAGAADSLQKRMAQSTSFSASFFNADALLSLSCTYPAPDDVAPLPDGYPNAHGSIRATHTAFEQRLKENKQRFEPYDLLPEFPALRYLDLGLAEFATNAKSAQWTIRGELDQLTQENRVMGTLRTITALPTIDRVYYRATALSVLRLPVARDFAERLITEEGLGSNDQAIEGMKASLLNTLVTILTVAAVLIGIIQVVLAL